MKDLRSKIPSVEKLLQRPKVLDAPYPLSHSTKVLIIQKILQSYREKAKANIEIPSIEAVEEELLQRMKCLALSSTRKVINATGIILHTNLGRAPLGKEVLNAMAETLSGYSNLEFDLATGTRGNRTDNIESRLCLLTGAEASIVVNNNAAALILVLSAYANHIPIAISRGELVQIGGGFRVPEIIESSGATLCEVGTTNITQLKDYEKAIKSGAGMVLKVHQSNFHITGHTESVSFKKLGTLCKKYNIPLVIDLGSGNLGKGPIQMPDHSISEALHAKANFTCVSGDKLLGSIQSGIILGSKKGIQKLKKHPLYRALRLGKTELFILEYTLNQLLRNEPTPTLNLINQTLQDLENRAQTLIALLAGTSKVKLERGVSKIGGGSLPNYEIPTVLMSIGCPNPEQVACQLRMGEPAIVTRLNQNKLVLDLRTILPEEIELLGFRLKECLNSEAATSCLS